MAVDFSFSDVVFECFAVDAGTVSFVFLLFVTLCFSDNVVVGVTLCLDSLLVAVVVVCFVVFVNEEVVLFPLFFLVDFSSLSSCRFSSFFILLCFGDTDTSLAEISRRALLARGINSNGAAFIVDFTICIWK